MPSREEQALKLIDDFHKAPHGHTPWYHVHRQELAAGMEDRVHHPNKVTQGHYGTCGASVLVRDIIEDDPVEYVKLTTSLYWHARCKIHHGRHAWGMPLTASYDLRRFKPDPCINPADWVLTSTVRDNLTFCRLKLFGPKAVEGTTFAQQAHLLQDIGYRAVVRDGHFGPPAPLLTMWDADSYWKRHFHVQIGINATLIKQGQQDDSPNGHHYHWVELLTSFTVDNESSPDATVSFSVWSWGHQKEYAVPLNPAVPLKLEVFRKKFFGYVAAKY